jgi:hypothetical protein
MFSENKKEFPFTFPSFDPQSFSAHHSEVWFCTLDSSSPRARQQPTLPFSPVGPRHSPLRLARSLVAAQLGPSTSPLHLLARPQARWSPSRPEHAGVHGGHGRPSPAVLGFHAKVVSCSRPYLRRRLLPREL